MFEDKNKKDEEKNIPLDYYAYFIAEYSDFDHYEVKIFRRIRSTGGRFKKEYLGKFFDAPPEEEVIAERWGPGDYTATSINPSTGKPHSRDLSIAEDLRYLYKPMGQAPGNFTPSNQPQQNAPPPIHQDPMMAMEKIFSGIVTPLVTLITKTQSGNGNNNNNAGNQGADTMQYIGQFMEGIMSTMATGFGRMQNQMIENTISNVKKIKAPTQEPEPQEDGNDWGWVIDLIKNFGSKIFDAEGNVKKGALASVQNNPAFKEVSNDQEKLDSLYFTLAGDKSVGKKKADGLFSSIGIEPVTDEEYNQLLAQKN